MRLKDLSWMDENTRNSAKRKVKKMFLHVGYSDEILNDTIIDKYYDNVRIFFKNYSFLPKNDNIDSF